MEITDTDRIEFLEKLFQDNQTEDYHRVVLRKSIYGRGIRLHHTRTENWKPNFSTAREAIDDAIQLKKTLLKNE